MLSDNLDKIPGKPLIKREFRSDAAAVLAEFGSNVKLASIVADCLLMPSALSPGNTIAFELSTLSKSSVPSLTQNEKATGSLQFEHDELSKKVHDADSAVLDSDKR